MDGFAIQRDADTARVTLAGTPDREALRACAKELAEGIESGVRHLEFDLTALCGLHASDAALLVRSATAIRKSAGSMRVHAAPGAPEAALRILGLVKGE